MKAKGINCKPLGPQEAAGVVGFGRRQKPEATLPHIRHLVVGSLCTVRKARKSKVFALQTTTNKTLSNLPQLERERADVLASASASATPPTHPPATRLARHSLVLVSSLVSFRASSQPKDNNFLGANALHTFRATPRSTYFFHFLPFYTL